MNVRTISPDDVILWPDGFWCFRYELDYMSHRSDDYEVIPEDTPRAHEVITNG